MNKEFEYKAIDKEGMETLEVVAEAENFNTWMYETIHPFCEGNILEIGSGIGNISIEFLKENKQISLTDLRENYCSILRNKFNSFSNLQAVLQMDIIDPQFDQKHADKFNTYDSIYALNIVEHVKDDNLAIANCKKLLKPGGKLTILVPAYQTLYNSFDKELEHYKRYTQQSLNELLTNNNLNIIHQQYYNFVGIFGWWFSGNILRKKTIPGGQMKLYNQLVPLIKIMDKIVFNKAGLSVISVGQKEI